MIALIVAYAKNQVIGNKGCIPWKIKGEQKRFRELTTEIELDVEGDTFSRHLIKKNL